MLSCRLYYLRFFLACASTVVYVIGGAKERSWTGPNTLISGNPPSPRDGFGSAMVHGSHMYIFGGISPSSILNDFYRFDTTSLTWTEIGSISKGSQPAPRFNFPMAAINDTIYVFSGVLRIMNPIDEFNGDFHKIDTASLEWTLVNNYASPSFPQTRCCAGMTEANGRIYLFGGKNAQGQRSRALYEFNPLTGLWRELFRNPAANVPSPRDYMKLLAIGSSLYIHGGRNGSRACSDEMFSLELASGNWTLIRSDGAPVARFGHGAEHFNGSIFVFGGQTPNIYLNDLHRFDLATSTWTQLVLEGPSPSTRSFFGTAASMSQVYIFAGWNGADFYNSLHSFKPAQASAHARSMAYWIDLTGPVNGEKPSARINHGFASGDDGSVFLFGGQDPKVNMTCLNDLFRFDPFDMRWSILPSIGQSPSPRAWMGLAISTGNVFVFGGRDYAGNFLNDFYQYNLARENWTTVDQDNSSLVPSPRSDFGFVAAESKLYVFGGNSAEGLLHDLFSFDPTSRVWDKIFQRSGPGPRSNFGFIGTAQSLFVFGGRNISGQVSNELYQYDLLSSNWSIYKAVEEYGIQPSARSFHRMAAIGSSLYVFGGIETLENCPGPKAFNTRYKNDLYRFDLVHKKWTDLSAAARAPPSARCGFGLADWRGRLVLYGGWDGQGSDEVWAIATPTIISWPIRAETGFFIDVYDWDTVAISRRQPTHGQNLLSMRISLCTGLFPCRLFIAGQDSGKLFRIGGGSIYCSGSLGCSYAQISNLDIECGDNMAPFAVLEAEGLSSMLVSNVSFTSCFSARDGGAVRSYGGASLQVLSSEFHNTTSAGCGGAIAAVGGVVSISKSIFNGCSAVSGGGAICTFDFVRYGQDEIIETTVRLSNTAFNGCTSNNIAGAVWASSSNKQTKVTVVIESCNFQACSATNFGGALTAESASVIVNIFNANFSACISSASGGAIAALDAAVVRVNASSFLNNSAHGNGGGAVYSKFSSLHMDALSDISGNTAPFGGGGVVFWESDDGPPEIAKGVMNCGTTNVAAYGPCVGSTFKMLAILGLPTNQAPGYAGVSFQVTVEMRDAYNQSIASDSTSLIQVFVAAAGDISSNIQATPRAVIIGNSIVRATSGRALFDLAIKPVFDFVRPSTSEARLQQTKIYFSGVESSTQIAMRSLDLEVVLNQGPSVCLPGYILSLNQGSADVQMSGLSSVGGVCEYCPRGKYSLVPLAGATDALPSCMPCPAGGDCSSGGDSVKFSVGTWQAAADGIYRLIDCPGGHQLVNSTSASSYGKFSQEMQTCKPCFPYQYIVDQREICQNCPTGATCDGSTGQLKGLAGSRWRREGDAFRVSRCDMGYIMIRDDSGSLSKRILDSCEKCPPAKYSLVGAELIGQSPCSFVGDPKQPYSCTYIANQVKGANGQDNGSWVQIPSLAESLCLPCPPGAACTGGSSIVPLEGFWTVSSAGGNENDGQRRTKAAMEIEVVRCPPGACLGNGTCSEGRTGPVCGLCIEGWAPTSSGCTDCRSTSNTAKIVFIVLSSVGLASLLYFFSFQSLFLKETKQSIEKVPAWKENEEDHGARESLSAKAYRNVQAVVIELNAKQNYIWAYLKVLIGFFQIVSTFNLNYTTTWPAEQLTMFSGGGGTRLDFIALPLINCVFADMSYLSQLMVYTLVPCGIIMLYAITPLSVFAFSSQFTKKHLDDVKTQFWWNITFFLFIIYPTLSLSCLRSFVCQPIGKATYLVADYRESCPYDYEAHKDGPVHQAQVFRTGTATFWYSFAFVLVYPFGIPLFFLVVMSWFRVPEIAKAKMNNAKVEALVISYKKAVVPLEAEILIQGLKLNDSSTTSEVHLEEKIEDLFQRLLAFKDITSRNYSANSTEKQDDIFITDQELFLHLQEQGLPDPDKDYLRRCVEEMDTNSDRKMEIEEFSKLMKQLLIMKALFTGYEALLDMNFDQLQRLYSFHHKSHIFIDQDRKDSRFNIKAAEAIVGCYLDFKNGSSPVLNKKVTRYPGFKTFLALRKFAFPPNVSDSERPNGDLQTYDAELFDYKSRSGSSAEEKMALLSENGFKEIQDYMKQDLRQKIRKIADLKARSGAIAIPSLSWSSRSSTEEAQDNVQQPDCFSNWTTKRLRTLETNALRHLEFLLVYFSVQHWDYELHEMFRKLFMTGVIPFIFPGTSAQLAAGLLITTASAVYSIYYWPFIDETINQMHVCSLLVQGLMLLYGLMMADVWLLEILEMDISFNTPGFQITLGVILAILSVIVALFPMFELLRRLNRTLFLWRIICGEASKTKSSTNSQPTRSNIICCTGTGESKKESSQPTVELLIDTQKPSEVQHKMSQQVNGSKVGSSTIDHVGNDGGLVYVDVTDNFFTSKYPLESSGSRLYQDAAEPMHSDYPVQKSASCSAGEAAGESSHNCNVDVTSKFFSGEELN